MGQCDDDLCAASPCFNGATCVSTVTGSSYLCQCPNGFHGYRCELSHDDCFQNAFCGEGATCIPSSDGFRCLCPLDRTGDLCQQDLGKVVVFFSILSCLGDVMSCPIVSAHIMAISVASCSLYFVWSWRISWICNVLYYQVVSFKTKAFMMLIIVKMIPQVTLENVKLLNFITIFGITWNKYKHAWHQWLTNSF